MPVSASLRVDVQLGATTDVAVRASRLATNLAGSTAVSIAAPTGTVAGDFVVVVVHANGEATTIVDNNGSTIFAEDVNDSTQGSHTVSLFSRTIQSGDPSTYNFTLGSSQRWTAVAVTFSNPHATPFEVTAAVTKAQPATSINTTDQTTTRDKAIHCLVGLVDGVTVAIGTTPSGYTVAQNGGDMGTAFVHKTITPAGATGVHAFSASGANPGMMAISFAVRSLASAAWTNITSDTVASLGMRWRRGMPAGGPLDRVATTGTLEFGLRNDAGNSGGVQGYYSPNHASKRSGWTYGIPVRVVATYSSTDYPLWRGRIRTIQPVAGRYGEQRVYVTAQDSMGDFAEARVREIAPQLDKSESQLVQAVIDALPENAKPAAVSYDTGLDSYPYAFDTIGDGATAMGLMTDVVISALGKLFVTNDGTLRYMSRNTAATKASSGTLTEGDLFHRDGLSVPSSLAMVYNRTRATVHPKTVDASAATVLYALPVASTATPSVTSVAPGQTITVWGNYFDPTNTLRLIGGTAQVTPIVATTDYLGNGAADGSGSNLTSSLSITTTAFASAVKFVITNTGSSTVYVTKLQIRGKGIYDHTPITVESYSAQSYGDRPLSIDLPYQDDPNTGQGFADYLTQQYLAVQNQAEHITVNPQESNTLMLHALQREIGDVMLVSETMTGLSSTKLTIHGIEFEVSEGPWLACRWIVAPSLTQDVWILGDAAASLLGSTTVLGY